jgi:lipoate synthase
MSFKNLALRTQLNPADSTGTSLSGYVKQSAFLDICDQAHPNSLECFKKIGAFNFGALGK